MRIQSSVFLSFEGNAACSVLGKDFVVIFAWKCTGSQEKNVEDESKAEDVADRLVFGAHVLDVDDLRSHIAWSAASNKEILRLV